MIFFRNVQAVQNCNHVANMNFSIFICKSIKNNEDKLIFFRFFREFLARSGKFCKF